MVQEGAAGASCRDFSLWADSFHEGEWACRAIAERVVSLGGTFEANYLKGFVPTFTYKVSGLEFVVTVYGNYASWAPQPKSLVALLSWGKPDLVLMRADNDEILLAVEETAATPTGNQALQRCERQYGAAREGFPFWYLISEFGIHSDGGIRRDSIWPTLMGLELMSATQVPSIVLHYSDLENPEDYSSGKGLESLFVVLVGVLINTSKGEAPLLGLQSELHNQVAEMLKFVDSTWSSSLFLIPDLSNLNLETLTKELESTSQTRISGTTNLHQNLLTWPLASGLSADQKKNQIARPLMKSDAFAEILESDLTLGRSYGVIKGIGSKPQNHESLSAWVETQNAKHFAWQEFSGRRDAPFELDVLDFPTSAAGNHHVITAQRILYLYDSTGDVLKALQKAFPRLKGAHLFDKEDLEKPALVYISNSVKPGRIFGDPYTGQLSAYSVGFGAITGSRKVIAYFPHQSVAQAAESLSNPNNKGLRMFAELTDLLVFGGGIAIRTKELDVI
jgi:hypothetical protein